MLNLSFSDNKALGGIFTGGQSNSIEVCVHLSVCPGINIMLDCVIPCVDTNIDCLSHSSLSSRSPQSLVLW